MNRLKSATPVLVLALILSWGFWSTCFRVTNEIGPLGSDKSGRQILLQTLDTYFDRSIDSATAGYAIDVDSEFHHTAFLWRMLQEPMRTTFSISYRVKDMSEFDSTVVERFLSAPASAFIDLYKEPASLRDDIEIPVDSLRSRLRELNVNTVADFLAAYGFRVFEASVNGRVLGQRPLPQIGRANVKWVGGE